MRKTRRGPPPSSPTLRHLRSASSISPLAKALCRVLLSSDVYRHRPSPAASGTADQRPHAAVIGSGLGGLAAAIRLGARGYRVSVFEKLEQPGGRAAVFRQDGFTFDAGPTIITAPFILEELWALAGGTFSDDVTLKPLDPFYDIRFDDGTVMSCSADPARMREEVRRISPGDVEGYERFMAESEAIYRIGFEQLGHVPFGSPLDMLKIAPDLLRLGAGAPCYHMSPPG